MGEFDYKLFHKLFDKLYEFNEFLDGEKEIEGAKVVESTFDSATKTLGQIDITDCLHLSIFDELKKMCKHGDFVRGENVNLAEYHEIKEGDKIVGAKGIMSSNMDWCDADNPQYYYEFAHLETGGKVEEYIRELHVDEIVMKVFSDSFGDKIISLPKGRDESKKLLDLLIQNSSKGEIDTVEPEGLKYKCLLEGVQNNGKYFEIWKLGYADGDKSYRLFLVGPQFLGAFNEDFVLKSYLQDKKLEKRFGLFKKMSEEEIAEMKMYGSEGTWYHEGKIELEAEKKKKKAKKSKAKKMPEDIDAILNPNGPDRKATTELIDALSTALKSPRIGDYTKELIEKIKKGYKIQSGENF